MDKKDLKQKGSNTLPENKQKTSNINANIDELKKEQHEPEYVFLYWE